MADALITVAVETFRDLLVEEIKFLSGVSNQVQQVERDLKTMHSLLKDADKWSNKNNPASLQDWIVKLQDLAFEAENVLQEYAFEVTFKRGGRNLKEKLKRFICILSEGFSVHQVGKEIEDIRSRLTDLTERLRSMSGGEGSSNSAEDEQHMLRRTYAHEAQEHFVGMEKDIEHLISVVKDDKRYSPVISIYGMGGLGKTTLARKVYNHKDLQGCFDARVWVCATQQFQARTILKEILEQLRLKVNNEDNIGELVVQLHNVLTQKKCLIVIDDIWKLEHWDILKPAFPTDCKVVLTTRTENIVSQECVYKLDFLTEDQGWQLLKKIAILKNDAPAFENRSRSLENNGRQIVGKCGRLPLAISVIGGILRHKQQTLAEWENVSSNLDSYLKHGEGVGNTKRVMQVLDLSYDVLPYYLKPCFLYLGLFPEDEEIEAERLHLLWMAEGLIPSEEKGSNETLKDVAARCLTELAFRCLVQLNKIRYAPGTDKIKTCRLHDLMRDLCSSKAEELEFFKRIDLCKSPTNDPPIGTSIKRLAIYVDNGTTTLSINGIQELKDLRSFLVLHKRWFFMFNEIHLQKSMINFEKSKYLRVLVLDNCAFEHGKLPSQVGKLIHLRFLSLAGLSIVGKLPPFACDMPYLLILDLRSLLTIKLPNRIWKMKKLRHLFLGDIDVVGGDKLILDGLTKLETLECGCGGKICIADIPKLTNLRELSIVLEDMDSLSMIEHHMSNNQSQLRKTVLTIKSCEFSLEGGMNVFKNILMSHLLVKLVLRDCEISCGFPCYEQGMCENLVSLNLDDCNIEGDVMEILGKYPILESLYLSGPAIKTKLIFGANSFPELKYLILFMSFYLKTWEVEEKALPKLSKLCITSCHNLEMIPDGVRFISTLEELDTYMPRQFNNRLRVVDGQPGEDYHKVCHIPSLDLGDEEDYEEMMLQVTEDEQGNSNGNSAAK